MNQLKVKIPAKAEYSYDILIGNGLLQEAGGLIKKYTKANKFLIVTNDKVYGLFGEKFQLDGAQFVILPDGEEYKNFENLKKILDAAIDFRLERKDCIVALGGGVIGDMAGFAAASYMRGVDFIQVPTTLLSMVDSSVGGKVAINHEHGKNLIGAFYQPKLVLADTETLDTLDLRQLKTGLAEVLKYAFIEKSCGRLSIEIPDQVRNDSFFRFLKKNKDAIYSKDSDVLSALINICCTLKAAVVNQDETEKGVRAILNFGHTFAHAIENLTNYTVYTHGEAVAMGMKMALKLGLIKCLIDKSYFDESIGLIDEYDLVPDGLEFCPEKFYYEMFLDKKAENGKVRFVLPVKPFEVGLFNDVTKEQVFESLRFEV